MLPERKPALFRLSADCQAMIQLLAASMGICKTAVVETAVRELIAMKRIKYSRANHEAIKK